MLPVNYESQWTEIQTCIMNWRKYYQAPPETEAHFDALAKLFRQEYKTLKQMTLLESMTAEWMLQHYKCHLIEIVDITPFSMNDPNIMCVRVKAYWIRPQANDGASISDIIECPQYFKLLIARGAQTMSENAQYHDTAKLRLVAIWPDTDSYSEVIKATIGRVPIEFFYRFLVLYAKDISTQNGTPFPLLDFLKNVNE